MLMRGGSAIGVQVGVVKFHSGADTLSPLSDDANVVNAAIRTYNADGQTNIGAGLLQAQSLLQRGRPTNAQQLIILLTDGEQSSQYGGDNAAINAAASVKLRGTRIIAVGFGGADPHTLASMASTPSELNSFTGGDIADVISHLSDVCTIVTSPRTPPPPQQLPPALPGTVLRCPLSIGVNWISFNVQAWLSSTECSSARVQTHAHCAHLAGWLRRRPTT